MSKKVFFVDIDGTIVDAPNGLSEPSKYTRYAFKELAKSDYVFISSGRNKSLMYKYITDLNPSGYILANGSHCELGGKVIYHKDINKDNLLKALDYINKHNMLYYRETPDKIYSNFIEVKALDKRFRDNWNMNCEILEENGQNDCAILMVVSNDEEGIKAFAKEFKDIFDIRRQYGFTSLDVGEYGENKGNGIKEVLKYLGIPKENAYAFGDGLNDLEMISAVKHGIVVESGFDELKGIAEEITESPLKDGFYKYLVRHKLIKPMEE